MIRGEKNLALDSIYSWPDVVEDVRHRAVALGISARTIPIDRRRTFYSLPVAVFPSRVDSRCFEKALSLQKLNNLIIHRIANSHEFLEEQLQNTNDEFVRKLYHIYFQTYLSGFQADFQVGIFRTDYMIDILKRLKQVETNTMAVGFGGISSKVTELHRYTMANYQQPALSTAQINKHLPPNKTLQAVAQTLVDAYNLYGEPSASILVVVQENEANSMDQKWIEWEIRRRLKTEIYRRTFDQLGKARDLMLRPNHTLELKVYNHSQGTICGAQIAVVYFRTGYRTADYPHESYYEIRQRIEKSNAIKCPSIQYQLAGLKHFQVLLSDREIFNHFIEPGEEEEAEQLFSTFSKFYKIDNKSRKMVENDPNSYVLKSNQEGGGNNVFGRAICEQLDQLSDTECRDLFLMEFIEQQSYYTEFVVEKENADDKELKDWELVDELGIFGVIIAEHSDKIFSNETGGHLLRSKPAKSHEAGIMSGAGILNSPYLEFDQEEMDTDIY